MVIIELYNFCRTLEGANYNMMNLDWYERVIGNLAQELHDACELAEELILAGQLQIHTSKLDKHPTISVVVSFTNGQYYEEPFVIHFDPYNQEFYAVVPEENVELRLMLRNTEEIVDFMHDQIHIAEMAHRTSEALLDSDGNETEVFNHFMGMVESFANGDSSHGHDKEYEFEDGSPEGLFFEQLANKEIEWFPKDIVTEAINKDDEKLQKVTSIRIGQFVNSDNYVLGRINSVIIDGKLDSEQGELFPFDKNEIAAFKEIFNLLQS